MSTTEAEYMAVVEANKEIMWMKEFIGELGIPQEEFQIHCDNQSAIHLAKNVESTTRGPNTSRGDIIGSRVSRRKGVCSDEDPHDRKWIRHVDEGVVGR
mgnify:CR=1 FL=1